jgi:GrpB-like predicted nucleotidyltransferase (UPF0157 family)
MESFPVRYVVVVPHDPHWPDLFQQEAAVLQQLFGRLALAYHHIGSTAIPGTSAKPIIDMLVEVLSLEPIDAITPALIAIGYIPKGESGVPERQFFIKGSDTLRTHHLHVFPVGHAQIARHLAFRDYLRAHRAEARAYSQLKEILARQFPWDIGSYIVGKDEWVKAAEQRALAWKTQVNS